jgi:hypothetical protein
MTLMLLQKVFRLIDQKRKKRLGEGDVSRSTRSARAPDGWIADCSQPNNISTALLVSLSRFSNIPDDPENPIYKLAMKNVKDYLIHIWIVAGK